MQEYWSSKNLSFIGCSYFNLLVSSSNKHLNTVNVMVRAAAFQHFILHSQKLVSFIFVDFFLNFAISSLCGPVDKVQGQSIYVFMALAHYSY